MKLRNRVLLVVLFVVMIWFVPNMVHADYEYENLKYVIDNEKNEVKITGVKDENVTSVTIPDTINEKNVTSIGEYAFEECRDLTDMIISNNVTSIGDGAFYNCKNLVNFNLPSSIISIGNDAFTSCEKLKSLEISENLTDIGLGTFRDCKALTTIDVLGNNEKYSSENGILFNKEKNKIICYPSGKKDCDVYTIPENITSIEYAAFWGCENLKNIIIPNNVIDIGSWTFVGCNKLENIEIPNSIDTIGNGMFWKCTNLTEIKISDTVNTIGNNAFENCTNLTHIELPESVINIGYTAFCRCTSLKSMRIPSKVTRINGETFAGCTSLLTIEIPSSVMEIINEELFYECNENLTLIVEKDSYAEEFAKTNNINFQYKKTAEDIFEYELDYETDTIRITGLKDKSITEIIIPNAIDGKSVTTIGESTFDGCVSLANVEMPNSLKIIGERAFFLCESLENIKIPECIESIGDEAFGLCNKLTSIIVDENNENFSSEDGILFNKDKTTLICYPMNKDEKSYILPTNITNIGNYAFDNNIYLESITIPNSVTNIGQGAFSGCRSLTSIEIPNSITIINRYTFDNCKNLKDITLPNTITSIEDSAIRCCTSLTSIEIPNSVTKMGQEMFSGCTNLVEVNIPYGIETIENNSFRECKSLKSIQIPDNIKNIEQGAFGICTNLNKVIIPNNVISIEENVFENCSGNLILIVNKDSYAEQYAKQNNLNYNILLSDCIIEDIENQIYTREEIKPSLIITNEDYVLEEGTDYELSYSNNTEVGTATIIITGKGNYDGELKKIFKIVKAQKNVTELTITGITDKTYTGNEIQQNIVVKDENTALKENTDYTVTYKNNKNVGTAKVTITGIGNYIGTKELTFKINKATYDMSKVKFENLTVTYDGKSHKITAIGLPTGVNVTYKNNDKTNVGTYTVTAVFTGDTTNYNTISDMTATLKINAKNISSTSISSVGNQTYTGKDIKPSVVVKDGNTTLKNETDYTVSYTNHQNTGKATITITGKGNYTGTKTTTFRIIPSQVTNLKTKSQKEKEITLQWSKNGGNVTGYKVYQYNSKTKKWDYVGKTSNTNYTIKKLKAGTTYSFIVRAYKTIDGTQYFGSYSSNINTSTAPSATKLKTLSTKNKKVTVKWNKVSGATGYEIYMSTSKNKGYSKIKTITKPSTVSYTKGSLKKNKTYYFKIRTYRTVNGKKIYSSYSNIKQIKVK